jgi:serine/threonine-protein kinase RsbW
VTGRPEEAVEVTFPGRSRYLPVIRDLVREALREDGAEPSPADIREILLAVQEGCVNAVRHGHEGDVSRPVTLRIENRSDRIELQIRDGGPGFRIPETVPAKTDVTQESGRGLAIMTAVMDEVAVERREGETVVRLVRRKGER